LLKVLPAEKANASKKRLNFCEDRSAISRLATRLRERPIWSLFPQKNRANTNIFPANALLWHEWIEAF
jgi:hypothetical protein